jgi:hypothetical protein
MAMMAMMALFLCLISMPLSAGKKKSSTDQSNSEARQEQVQQPTGTPIPGFELIGVTFTSVPPGASIQVELSPAGRTPAVVKLQPRDYRVTLTLKGYESWSQRITVGAGQGNTVTAELQPKVVSDAAPKSPPSDRTVISRSPAPLEKEAVVEDPSAASVSKAGTVPPPAERKAAETATTETESVGTRTADQQRYVGPRGGIYHYSKSGKKVYEKRK